MTKPKLFFMINTLHKGGAERVLSTLSNKFYERNFSVFIICLNYSAQSYPISKGIKIIYLLNKIKRSDAFIMRILYGIMTYVRLLLLLWRERPSCMIAFMTTSNLWAGLSCSLSGTPYIVSERITPDLTIKKFGPVLRGLSYLVFKKAKAIVSPAKGIEDCLKEIAGFAKLDNYKVINNPVNPLNLGPGVVETAVHNKPFILAVGRLTSQKGFDLLIDSFSKLADIDVDLLIIGQGIEEQHLRSQIDKLGLSSRIFLLGIRNDLAHYYKQAEVFVLSSRNEGYPNALIEAMSMGCPCIAMNCNFGPSEIIRNGINGVLLETYDSTVLAEAIRELLNNLSLRKTLSENAKLVNKTNSLEVIMDKWEKIITCD